MTIEHLRFAPDILRRLGEELVPHPDQGIIELVRNAYDADALTCRIELHDTDAKGGSILVTDDGSGMDLQSIQNGWLVLGKSGKSERRRTKKGRLPVGDKGLGRLAALRLGNAAVLRSRPAHERGVEYLLTIDWSRFDDAAVVEEVPLEVRRQSTTRSHGTEIEIRNLDVALGRREVQRLARALVLLADPFDRKAGFRPKLVAPAFTQFERLVRRAYFDAAEYHLVATLTDGKIKAEVRDWRNRVIWKADHRAVARTNTTYKTPSASFDLWTFILDAKSFASRDATLTEVKAWLTAVGGVHLYHRGLRVHPYGDKGHDWLDMNLSRVRSPELRPGTNTSIGRMVVLDPDDRLLEKTDRSGFVENEEFQDLRRFAIDALDWMARERLRAREAEKQAQRSVTPKVVTQARQSLDRAIAELPASSRVVVEKAVQRVERAREREASFLREEVELYRTLSTVGTSAAVFAHESGKPVTNIQQMATVIRDRAREALGESYDDILARPVDIVIKSAQSLKTFADLPIKLLERKKRRVGPVNVNHVVNETLLLFAPFLADAKIVPVANLVDTDPIIHGTEATIQAIVANLVTNVINAFTKKGARVKARQLLVTTEISRERLMLRVMDNGPGITDIAIDDIWLPGQTTVPGGTGLGLSIVRDAAAGLGGQARAIARGELGGAEFVIEFPLSSPAS
ncbi:MAG TPA: ATP-binding protein [Steroidobacter sp.]